MISYIYDMYNSSFIYFFDSNKRSGGRLFHFYDSFSVKLLKWIRNVLKRFHFYGSFSKRTNEQTKKSDLNVQNLENCLCFPTNEQTERTNQPKGYYKQKHNCYVLQLISKYKLRLFNELKWTKQSRSAEWIIHVHY